MSHLRHNRSANAEAVGYHHVDLPLSVFLAHTLVRGQTRKRRLQWGQVVAAGHTDEEQRAWLTATSRNKYKQMKCDLSNEEPKVMMTNVHPNVVPNLYSFLSSVQENTYKKKWISFHSGKVFWCYWSYRFITTWRKWLQSHCVWKDVGSFIALTCALTLSWPVSCVCSTSDEATRVCLLL